MTAVKKLLSLALVFALGASLLAGCSNGDSSSSASSSAGAAVEIEPMDLTGVTDPYLATAGLAEDTPVATVGEYEITAAEMLYWLHYQIDLYLTQASSYGITEISWDAQDESGQTLKDALKDAALETAAFYRLLPELGTELGLSLTQEALDAPTQDLAAGLEELGDEMLMEHLLWFGMLSKDQYVRLHHGGAMYQLVENLYFGEGTEDYPTDAEVLSYAQDDLGYYRAKHILLATVDSETQEPLDEDEIAKKKAKAEELLAQLRSAEDPVALFDQLMNEHSEDPGLAESPDGYEAYIGQMVSEFEDTALALRDGEISDVVESSYGYHIILRLPLELTKFRTALVSQKMEEKIDEWLEEYGIQTADAFQAIDPQTYRENALSLQATVMEEMDSANEQLPDSAPSGQG